MAITHLVVTRPPYPDDIAPVVAPVIGLPVYETKQYLRHPLPDILRTFATAEAAVRAADSFRKAGMSVDVVPVGALAAIPAHEYVVSFRFTPETATWGLQQGEFSAPWNAHRLFVLIQGSYTLNRVDLTGAIHGSTVDYYPRGDLFLHTDGKMRRLLLDQRNIDFSGLGDRKCPGARENWWAMMEDLRGRAPAMIVDELLIKNKPRMVTAEGKTYAALVEGESELVRASIANYGEEFYQSLCAVRVLSPEAITESTANPLPAAPSPVKNPAPAGAVATPKPPPPSAPPPGPKSSASTPSPAPAIKSFCEKCFKEVAPGPDRRCPTCGADLSEEQKRKELAKERSREGKSALEMIGIALAALGGVLAIGALRGGRGAGFASGVLALFLSGLLLLAVGGGLYGLGYWLKWRN